MKRLSFLVALATTLGAALGFAAPAVAAPESLRVVTDPSRVTTVLGAHFTIRTEITNTGSAATGPLLAHLNVASVTGGVYVDPEDWSSNRSQELSLRPGASRTLTWQLQAVNAGSFAVYLVVLPFSTETVGREPLVVSPLVRLQVAKRPTLNTGGALWVALVVPLMLGGIAAGTRLRRARE